MASYHAPHRWSFFDYVKLITFIGFLYLIVMLGIWILKEGNKFQPCVAKSTLIARPIISSEVPIQHLWSMSGFNLQNSDSHNLMVSTSDAVIIVSGGCRAILSLNIITGQQNWIHLPNNIEAKFVVGDLMYPNHITLDESRQQVYVSAMSEIRAISTKDGSPIWRNVSKHFERTTHNAVIDENGQLIVSARGFWYINPDNGLLATEPFSLPNIPFEPTIDKDAVEFVKTIEENYQPISNLVSTDTHIYLLDELARFHVIDKKSGSDTSLIRFSEPEKSDLLYKHGAIGGSWIALQNNILIIYFQDTNTLESYELFVDE